MANYRYQIVLKNSLSQDNENVIVQLYQPILGLVSTQIYFTLIEEEKLMRNMPKSVFTQEELANKLGLDIHGLKKELRKLEGMGLVKTYVNHKNKTLTYDLQKPLEPRDFFNNLLFNDVLKHKLGAERYEMVKVFYLSDSVLNEDYVDQSANFEQAFALEFQSFKSHDLNKQETLIDQDLIDFSTIEQGMLKEGMDVAALTEQVKTVILANMNHVSFSNEELMGVIKEAYDFDNYQINLDSLRVLIKNLVVSKQDQSVDELTATKIKEMEEHDAEEYAALLVEHPCDRTVKNIINNLRNKIYAGKQRVNDGIVNCLLEFSYWKNNTKIVGNYLYKVADSVVEKGLDTTAKVMNYLKGVATYTKDKFNNAKEKVQQGFDKVKENISDHAHELELRQQDSNQAIAWLRAELNN